MKNKQKLIDNLEKFIKHKTIPNKAIGLCQNFYIGYTLNYQVTRRIFKSWTYYSGNLGYPVPSTISTKDPKDFYHSARTKLYQGKQLEYRLDLAKHLVKEINLLLENNYGKS